MADAAAVEQLVEIALAARFGLADDASIKEKEIRLLTRSFAAAVLTAGCYLSIPAVNVLAQSPSPAPSGSAPDLWDQSGPPPLKFTIGR